MKTLAARRACSLPKPISTTRCRGLSMVATGSLWERYQMSLDKLTDRLDRITAALTGMGVPYALVGGQAVIFWVSTKDPAAVRTTKDVDILVDRSDLPK